MSEPRVSVLLPIYNGARFLGATLDSVLAQTLPDFELIAVDDGSTDKSADILAEFSKRDSRIKVVRKENSGISETLNEGLRWARAAFVARIDSDDLMFPHRIEQQTAFLQASPEIAFCSSAVSLIDGQGNTFGESRLPPATKGELQEMIERRVPISFTHPAVMYRRGAVIAAGGYNKIYEPCEDLELFSRLILRGAIGLVIPETLTAYRVHGTSISGSQVLKQIRMREFVTCNFLRERDGLQRLTQEEYATQLRRGSTVERIRIHGRRASAAHKQLALYARAERQRFREMKHYLVASLWRPAPAARFVAARALSLLGRMLPTRRRNSLRQRRPNGVITRR